MASETRCNTSEATQNIVALFDDAAEHYKSFKVQREDFQTHLQSVNAETIGPAEARAVYLCVACASGCHRASQQLDQLFFPALRQQVSTIDSNFGFVDDVLQLVRLKLLVGSQPKILSYGGKGSFPGWLAIITRRLALDVLRSNRQWERRHRALARERESSARNSIAEECSFHPRDTPLLGGALQMALASLTHDEQLLLHQYYWSGHGITTLGEMHRVDRATAARRIQRAVCRARTRLRKELNPHFGYVSLGELRGCTSLLEQHGSGKFSLEDS